MLKLYAATIAIVCTSSAYAQSTKVTGLITDKKGTPVDLAGVYLLNTADSSIVKSELSDAAGKFEIVANKGGSYLLRVSSVGYTTTYSTAFMVSDNTTFSAPTIQLATTTKELETVAVTAKKPTIEVKSDKVVFNVENSINATGSNAMELLQKSPGVMVDNNDNISMKGKSGVRIYIDGKMSQLDAKDLAAYLKSINSNDIESIEMISNPSAKYDASGNAGIINIKLKKNKKIGTNGSVTLGYVQGYTPKSNASVNLNYRNEKINAYGNVGYSNGIYENGMNFDRHQRDTLYIQKSANKSNFNNYNAKAGIDYFINNKNTIGIMATGNISEGEWKSEGNTNIYDDATNVFIKKLRAYNNVPGTKLNTNVNLNYKYTDSLTDINVDADYGVFRGNSKSTQPNTYYTEAGSFINQITNKSYTPTDIDIYTIKADYERKVGKSKLGFGGKVSYVNTANTFDFFNRTNNDDVLVKERSNKFNYKENVNALYANYNVAFNDKWSIQAGLRMENTHSIGELSRADGIIQADNTVDRNYTDLFPSAAVTWNMNKKHTLNLTYSRRIDRPTYQDLNPFEMKLDEMTYEKGNAFLKPQYTNSVELTHTFMGFFNTTLGYSKVDDYATQITDTTGNATYVQQRNLATQQMINASIGAPLPIAKWWSGYVNLWYSYQMFDGAISKNSFSLNIPTYGAYMQQTFVLSPKYSAEISGWYNGPSVWGGTWRTKGQGAIDLGFQAKVLKDKGNLKFSITDPFFTAPWRAENDFAGIKIKGGGYWESRTARINFTYRFGNSQVKTARQRKTGLESENNRIKG